MSLAALMSLNAMVRSLFHHGLDLLHIWCVGTVFAAACSMQELRNLTTLSSSSGEACVWLELSTCWINMSNSSSSRCSSCFKASTNFSSLASFQLYLASVMLSTDSLGSPSMYMRA